MLMDLLPQAVEEALVWFAFVNVFDLLLKWFGLLLFFMITIRRNSCLFGKANLCWVIFFNESALHPRLGGRGWTQYLFLASSHPSFHGFLLRLLDALLFKASQSVTFQVLISSSWGVSFGCRFQIGTDLNFLLIWQLNVQIIIRALFIQLSPFALHWWPFLKWFRKLSHLVSLAFLGVLVA